MNCAKLLRLKNGPAHPSRRYIRRVAGAILSELIAEGMADLYWQRRRLRAELDRHIVNARIQGRRQVVPQPAAKRHCASGKWAASPGTCYARTLESGQNCPPENNFRSQIFQPLR